MELRDTKADLAHTMMVLAMKEREEGEDMGAVKAGRCCETENPDMVTHGQPA